ncbi:hypothetical protein [Streptomyces sp. NPDC057616]|uniref:hypothetical protein n=1 Tax=Streptomyces sp. NPDC057616 TaxID=3346183 RepID=UPI003681C0DB
MVLDEGGYEIVLRDSARREHQVTADTDIGGGIANDLIIWVATRDYPEQPTQHTKTVQNGS